MIAGRRHSGWRDTEPQLPAPDSGHYEVASDEGGVNWAIIASLLETCKLNDVNPHVWLTDTLTKLVNHWPASRIDDLISWNHAKAGAQPVNV